jgi:prephenate dehydratase
MTEAECWLAIPAAGCPGGPAIGTLGPAGTSSEVAAEVLRGKMRLPEEDARRINLYDSYEAAADALRCREVSHLVVANAYAAINEFYMDTRMSLAGVFVMDTPEYGIAGLPGRAISARPVIATHPAPRPLVDQLLPGGCAGSEILQVTSTSAAAKAASEEVTDLALTTAPAAKSYGLEFISPTRTIRMVWSVFVSAV